jgi:hypothetical protein
MPIRDHRIKDLRSFEETTEEPRQIAGLYFYQILDCLVDLAFKVTIDFRKRPQLYKNLGNPSIAPTLAALNAKYGTEVNFLSRNERNEIYVPIFGSWDGSSSNQTDSFPRLRNDLVRAATAFALGAEEGAAILREGVRTAHRPFKDYLVGLQGDSVRFSKDTALSDLTEKTCYPILRNREVAGIFGVTGIRGGDYPYATDPAEDILVEQICMQLSRIDNFPIYLTTERISNLQRAALRGVEAIATVIDFEDDPNNTTADLDLLISKCYTWGTALNDLNGQPMAAQARIAPAAAASHASAQLAAPYGLR